jgi:hemerythrin superfamily protein
VFDPLDHPGLPVERHGWHWHELDVEPIDARRSDPGAPSRIRTMEALEAAAALFDQRLTPRCPDADARGSVGRLGEFTSDRRRHVAALRPAPGSALEDAIGSERAAYDLVAWVARSEVTPQRAAASRRQVRRHLERLRSYAELGDRAGFGWADKVGGEVEDLSAAATSRAQDRRRAAPAGGMADRPMSLLYDWAVRAAQQQIARHTRGIARQLPGLDRAEDLRRRGYRLGSGRLRWERLVVHESATCYLYYCFLRDETESKLRPLWELHLQMGLAHLRVTGDLLRRYTGQDPHEVVGTGLPEPEAWHAFRTRLWVAPADDDTGSGDVSDGANGEQDVVDLLTDQHRQIERLFQRVLQSEGDDQHAAFGELARLIAVHEVVEQAVVHPLTRRLEPDEHQADHLLDEERRISDALEDAIRVGADGDAGEIGALRDMVLSHARREEREEFPVVRKAVPADELRQLAQAIREAVADDDDRQTLWQTVERVRDRLPELSAAL